MKGQNIEKNVDKNNSIECVKLIRKQAIILCFSAQQNVPQKPRKLNMQTELIIDLGGQKENKNRVSILEL